MWKVIHRLAPIHFYGLSSKAASYRSWSNRLLVRLSVHSERGAEISYIYQLGSRLEFGANQIGEASHSPTLPPSVFPSHSTMSKNIPSTLGAIFIGSSIAGVYVLLAPYKLCWRRNSPLDRLTGIVCTQVSMYFRQYQRDKVSIKLMVSPFLGARFGRSVKSQKGVCGLVSARLQPPHTSNLMVEIGYSTCCTQS